MLTLLVKKMVTGILLVNSAETVSDTILLTLLLAIHAVRK